MLSGTGTARKRTIPALLTSELCRVTVAHGRDDDRLAQVRELDTSIRIATSEREFAALRDHYDVVYIASPPFLHRAHVELAVRLGAPIICEKPLVADPRELDAIVRLVERSGLPFMVAHQVRHQPAVAHVADILTSRRLGNPVAADLQWCFVMSHEAPNARWKLRPDLGGTGAMYDAGVHAVDLALLFFGVPARVSAIGHHVRCASVFDTVTAVLDYTSFAATIVASQSASSADNDLRITFPSAALHVPGLLRETSARVVVVTDGQERTECAFEPLDLYRAEVERFCLALATAQPAGTTINEAAAAVRIMAAIDDSVATGRVVPVGR